MTDILMVLLFPFLDFIPFGLPRYWLFKDRLRLRFRTVVFLMILISALNSACFYYINMDGYASAAQFTTLMRYGFMLINLTLSFTLIRDSFPKLMFTYLLLLSWSFFVFGNANFIESRFFSVFSDQHPYLVYNIARILLLIVTYPLMLHFLSHTVKNALAIDDQKLWRFMWIIPLFSTLFGMLYCTVDDVYAYASWQFFISRYLMLLGTCYVSYVVLKVLEIARQNTRLTESLKFANLNRISQKRQMDRLTTQMELTRKARHDLRQHLAVVQSYIEHNDREGLSEYIDIYKKELPPDVIELYCRNDALNAIVCFYATLARENKIQFDAKVSLPDVCPVADTDMTVLLGNLLENAVEACMRETHIKPMIHLQVKTYHDHLFFLVDNTCTQPVDFTGDTWPSSKRNGPGIGIASIREIASRYRGTAEFKKKETVFCASVILQLS